MPEHNQKLEAALKVLTLGVQQYLRHVPEPPDDPVLQEVDKEVIKLAELLLDESGIDRGKRLNW